MKKKVIYTLSALVLVACATTKMVGPSQQDVDRVQSIYPNYTLSELNEGKLLYEKNCVACHALKSPKSESKEEWEKIVPAMVNMANSKKGMNIDAKTQESILRYVVTMSGSKN